VIEKIELVKKGEVRRAKLYYLRDLRGKAAKIREKRDGVEGYGDGILSTPEPVVVAPVVSAPIVEEAVSEVPAVEATTDVVVETAEAVVEAPAVEATPDVVVETVAEVAVEVEAVVEAPAVEEAAEEAPKAE